ALANKNFSRVKVVSDEQLDYMQQFVTKKLGYPNLPDGWWGNEKYYSLHQIAMREKVRSLAKERRSHQDASRTVQNVAIPLYKELMPANQSSKKSDGSRASLARNLTRHQTLERVAKKEATARDQHGTMHAGRVALWSLVLHRLYEKFGRSDARNTTYLALT